MSILAVNNGGAPLPLPLLVILVPLSVVFFLASKSMKEFIIGSVSWNILGIGFSFCLSSLCKSIFIFSVFLLCLFSISLTNSLCNCFLGLMYSVSESSNLFDGKTER